MKRPITDAETGVNSSDPMAGLRHQAHQLCAVMASIHRRGWCEGTGGNFSCVARREPLLLLMAPSGVDKGRMEAGDLILVNGQAEVEEGQGKASAETLLHLEIVQRTGAGAVLHTHSQAGTLLSSWLDPAADPSAEQGERSAVNHLELSDLEMLKGLEGVRTHQTVVRVPVLSNDQNLRRLSAQASPHLSAAPHGLLIAGHGLYVWGRDLGEAMRHLEIHEFLLEQQWRRLLLQALQPRPTSRKPQP